MHAVLEGIRIKNFKSIKDAEIKLSQINVLVGPNGSGKTNLVDALLLLKRIYGDHEKNPFSYWWGYPNVVYGNREDDSISMELDFKIITGTQEFPATFRTEFTGTGGEFLILEEILEIEKNVVIKRSGNKLRVIVDDSIQEQMKKEVERWTTRIKKRLKMKKVKEQLQAVREIMSTFIDEGMIPKDDQNSQGGRKIFTIQEGTMLDVKYAFLPPIFFKNMFSEDLAKSFDDLTIRDLRLGTMAGGIAPLFEGTTLPQFALLFIHRLLGEAIILKVNTFRMKEPQPIDTSKTLSMDGSNTCAILHSSFLENGRLPKSISNVLSHVFPGLEVRLQMTSDHRVHFKVVQDGTSLVAPALPDGLYKVLAILTALEMKPPLIVIDEIENSIHPETMDYVLDELKLEEETTTLATTHSSSVVDMTPLENLIISEMSGGRTLFRKIHNPKEARRRLQKLGLTFSEGWLHGALH